jgi:hypothetical protein
LKEHSFGRHVDGVVRLAPHQVVVLLVEALRGVAQHVCVVRRELVVLLLDYVVVVQDIFQQGGRVLKTCSYGC